MRLCGVMLFMNHPNSCMRSLLVKMLWSISAMLVISSLAAPVLESFRMPQAGIVYYCLKYICHQIPSRCFWILDSNAGLCARCFGVYLSFTLCFIFIFFKMPSVSLKLRRFGVFLTVPLLTDGLAATLTCYTSCNCVRFATGMLFGAGATILYLTIVVRRKK